MPALCAQQPPSPPAQGAAETTKACSFSLCTDATGHTPQAQSPRSAAARVPHHLLSALLSSFPLPVHHLATLTPMSALPTPRCPVQPGRAGRSQCLPRAHQPLLPSVTSGHSHARTNCSFLRLMPGPQVFPKASGPLQHLSSRKFCRPVCGLL